MAAALQPGQERLNMSVSPPITPPYNGERPSGRPGRPAGRFPGSPGRDGNHARSSPPPQDITRFANESPSAARVEEAEAVPSAATGAEGHEEGEDGVAPMGTSASMRKNPLGSRLQRKVEAQSFSPAQASIIAAAQGLSEESLLVIADLVTYVCKKLGGRATQGQRRGANRMSEGAQTVDYISEWVEMQNELLGHNMLPTEYDRYCHSQWAPASHRRSSSCPQPRDRRGHGVENTLDLQKGSRVAAAKDIKSKKVVVVSFGTEGVVNYVENGRVNVTFESRCDGSERPINLKEECLTLLEQPEGYVFNSFAGFGDDSSDRGAS